MHANAAHIKACCEVPSRHDSSAHSTLPVKKAGRYLAVDELSQQIDMMAKVVDRQVVEEAGHRPLLGAAEQYPAAEDPSSHITSTLGSQGPI